MGVDRIRHALRAVILPLAAYVGLAVLMTWPLARHLSSALPGPPGDNVAFLWNFWWMREALASGSSPFWTAFLFAPYGVNLTLNTHAALPAFIGATLLAPLNIIAAQNVMTLATLSLNGFAAFRLAATLTTDTGAAFAGGVVFALSAYISAHLMGHFNLVSAYVLPLFILSWMAAVRGSTGATTPVRHRIAPYLPAMAAGLILAATAFVDYYYLVYELAIAALIPLAEGCRLSISRTRPNPIARRLMWIAGVGAVLTAIAIPIIAVTGGVQFALGSIRVSMRTTYNARQIVWVLIGISGLLWWSPRCRVRVREGWSPGPTLRAMSIAGSIFVLLASPLIVRAIPLLTGGDYVSQQYFWRSAPVGVDLVTLALGNPLNPVWGSGVSSLYARLGVNPIESLGWLGVLPMWLAFRAVRREVWTSAVRTWVVLGGFFFVWALGPHLRVFGVDTGMVLPQTVLHFLPVISNARMPARAMVVVSLAVAMLSSIASSRIRRHSRQPALILLLLVLAVMAENLPAPFPLLPLERPVIYEVLRERPEPGGLCELPLGTQDGFGTMGALQPHALFYQTIHARPIVGGMISRLPASVRAGYESDGVINAFLRLSEPATIDPALPTREQVIDSFGASRIAFVMLNRRSAPAPLVAFVEQALRFPEIARDESRTLYRVPDVP